MPVPSLPVRRRRVGARRARVQSTPDGRQRNELLQTVVDHIPVMVAVIGPNRRFKWINKEWERVLGWTLEEARHLDLFAMAYPNPEDRQSALDVVDGAVGWRDFQTRCKDGRVVETSWALVPLQDGTRIGIGQDVSELKKTVAALRHSNDQLRRLSGRASHLIERQRTDTARELHDQLGQLLTALKMDLAWIAPRLQTGDADVVRGKIVSMEMATDAIIQSVRRISAGLRPVALDRLGLIDAIHFEACEFERRSGVRCRVVSQVDSLEMEVGRATQLFRIVQEALTNTTRHANATRVTITARQTRQTFRLEIRDNGCGISDAALADSGALGLLGMRERALLAGATLEIARAGRKGTIVEVVAPLAPPPRERTHPGRG